MRPECIFCKIIAGQIPAAKIYEDQSCFAFLDIGPISPGHALVIPKEHYVRVDECPPHVLAELWSAMPKIAAAVCTAMHAQGYNILCNNGRVAGQVVEHVHFHIIPRNSGDTLFGNWPAFKYEAGKIEELTTAIKDIL